MLHVKVTEVDQPGTSIIIFTVAEQPSRSGTAVKYYKPLTNQSKVNIVDDSNHMVLAKTGNQGKANIVDDSNHTVLAKTGKRNIEVWWNVYC